MTIECGLTATLTHRVSDADLAIQWGGQARVLASPCLIGLVERACMRATDHRLASGMVTLGVGFDVKHTAPTPDGWTVIVSCKLEKLDGRQLVYSFSVTDGAGEVSVGTHVRAVVELNRFNERLAQRAASIQSNA